MPTSDMMQIQTRLEAEMASLGVDKFRRESLAAKQEGRATDSLSVRIAMDSLIAPLTAAVDGFLNADRGKGRPPHAATLMATLDPASLAYVTTKLVLNRIISSPNVTALAQRIGSYVELEARLKAYERVRPAFLQAVEKDLDSRTGHVGTRMAVFRTMLKKDPDNWAAWGKADQILVGVKLIELMTSSTGMLDIVTEHHRKREVTTLKATERFNLWLATLDDRLEIMSPEYLPCVVPPKDWTSLDEGGYHTDAFPFPITLVKTRRKGHVAALRNADLSLTMRAVNGIQRTPWAVNQRVLEVAEALIAAGSPVAGLTSMVDEPVPTKPMDIDTNEVERMAWKRAASKVHRGNAKALSKRLAMLRTVHTAKKFEEFPAIYFPYQLDFRGRIYTVPQVFSPQGQDLAKGLLQFAEGVPMDTDKAHDWFMTHGANSYGIDKVSFEDRHRWVRDNHQDLMRSALTPLDHLWWAGADSPFVFLAWCFEYARWVNQGDAFRAHVVPAMDGTCNGLQHYSAMLRDPVAGAAVNLTPSDKPQDIYGEVAKVANDSLDTEMDLLADEAAAKVASVLEDEGRTATQAAWAKAWLTFGIDRKITKRPVMVLPYGGTLSSCQTYVREAVEEKLKSGSSLDIPEDQLYPACNWLAGVVWSSIGEVVVSARLAMSFLQACAQVVSAAGHSITWTTPSGFPVVQAYPEMKLKRIDTRLLGQRFQPSFMEDMENELDVRRQRNSIAPNFVHSLDASALVLTVNRALDEGITRFAMIHDSYATDVARTADLARVLRVSFVEMYENNDVLEQFKESVSKDLPEEAKDSIPSVPVVGGLDLSSVLQSRYFFA